MKVTYNWLKDMVDIDIAPELLAEKLWKLRKLSIKTSIFIML